MSFFKNKHVLIATLMAPVLGLVTYFAVGKLVGEQPHPAEVGNTYQLIEKPNCRHGSGLGLCGLKNVDFELTLSFEWLVNDRMLLKLKSEHPLDGVMLALVDGEVPENQPEAMRPMDEDGLSWSMEIPHPDPENDRLRLVASANQVLYFGDVATKFILAKTL